MRILWSLECNKSATPQYVQYFKKYNVSVDRGRLSFILVVWVISIQCVLPFEILALQDKTNCKCLIPYLVLKSLWKSFMTRNCFLKNYKVHYVRIIVWWFIFERNNVKCHIGAFENATTRRKNGRYFTPKWPDCFYSESHEGCQVLTNSSQDMDHFSPPCRIFKCFNT